MDVFSIYSNIRIIILLSAAILRFVIIFYKVETFFELKLLFLTN